MNLLDHPILRLRTDHGVRTITLPGALAALISEDVLDLPALRPHQTSAAFALLVQLAACALRDEAGPAPPDEVAWRRLLVALSDGDERAWDLVGEDIRQPAFLQPPITDGGLSGFGRRLQAPDQLDVPVTAKNHDLKATRIPGDDAEAWLWALVTLQTTDGYPGRGYYGIFRMNGGFGNRAQVAFVPGRSVSARFRADLARLRAAHDRVAEAYHFDPDGRRLLWIEPWDGATSYSLASLDPWCVEICRRVRLVQRGDDIEALLRSTTAPRCDGGARKGAVGDPWLPARLESGEAQALTVGPSGFHYRLVADLLDGRRWSGLTLDRPAPDSRYLYMATLVRGQGKTDGWHERWVEVDARVVSLLADPDQRSLLVKRAHRWIEITATIQRKCLFPAVTSLCAGGGEGRADDRAGRSTSNVDQAVDAVFFQELWAYAEQADDPASAAWAARVYALAKAELEAAIAALSVPTERRYAAIAAAERIFHGSFYKHFPKEVTV